MSIGGSSGSSQTQLDPDLKAKWEDLYGQAGVTAAQPTPQQQTAGFTPTQTLGQQMTVNAASAGSGALNEAINKAGNMAEGVGGIPVTAAYAGVNDTLGTPDSTVMSYVPVQGVQQGDLSQYMDPYQQDVTDATMQQADLARRQALVGNQAGITASGGEGAWNGARAGVQNAQTNALALGQENNLLSTLNQNNFNNAQQQALSYGTLGQQAATTNLGANLTKDSTIYQGDLTTNLANQAAQNANAEANAQRVQAASVANQGEYDNELNRILPASALLGTLSAQQQQQALTGAQAVTGVGAAQQAQQQNVLNAAYTNAQNTRNEPLQTLESAFGIIPKTDSGSVTNSSGKSAGIGG